MKKNYFSYKSQHINAFGFAKIPLGRFLPTFIDVTTEFSTEKNKPFLCRL